MLAEVTSGNSVVGCRLSVYFLLVYFLLSRKLLGKLGSDVGLPPSASISAMYLSKSSVLDFVGIR